MQSRHRAAETAGKFGIAVELPDILCKFTWEKIVSGNVHLIARSQHDMVYATFAAVVEAKNGFFAKPKGPQYGASCRNLDCRQTLTEPSRAPAGRTAC